MNFKLNTTLIDKTFSAENSSIYLLSISLGMDGISFAIADTNRNKYIVLENYEITNCITNNQLIEAFTEIVKSNSKLSLPYKTVIVNIQNNQSIQIPKVVYDLKHLPEFLKFHNILNTGEVADSDFLKASDIYNAYSSAIVIKAAIKKQYQNAKIVHYSSSLLQNLLTTNKNNTETNCYLHIQKSFFDIIILEKGNLKLFNSYKYTEINDLMYFLLYTFEQLKLNPETLPVTLLCEFDKSDDTFEILHKYIRNIDFIKRSNAFEYSFNFSDIPEHFYYNLLSQPACEL